MVFQQGHIREHFGCQMEIEITQEKVVGYALELFNVKVEDIHGVRSVRYPGGGKIEPDPSIKLRGCRRDMGHIFSCILLLVYRSPFSLRLQPRIRPRTPV
ncbi:hypothetical protein QBC37DRAFT_435521 [Rhypophila decipiens]|uniref:Uncharacterized protein n=1 Tax=Rhypophila decipiens TaxID=261697 RepID=A0AAN6XSE5_9PEZI|nr:hypothetical protein QBC37DRAFT_435521 [Rhypophila decipiens]